MRGRNAFERAPVRLNVGAEKEVGQDRRQGSGHPTGINGNDVNRAQMANFGHNGGIREQPRRKDVAPNSASMTYMGRPNDMFGIIVSIKEAFGVIQLLRTEEQIIFSVRDGNRDVAIGDEVSFIVKHTPKGVQADGLQLMIPELKRSASNLLGTIVSPPDSSRGTPGLIEVSSQVDSFFGFQVGHIVPFMVDDYRGMYSPNLPHGGAVNQAPSRIAKGDQVHCTATHFQSIGGVRERGVVDSLSNAEYGFIKPEDRSEQIYFRIEDFRDNDLAQIRMGAEVDFFVIHQTVKGKLCDRAVNLQILPPGSVQFENTIAENVEAVVCVEAKMSGKDEEPGLLKLLNPVKRDGKPDLADIELWPRCVPDGMIFKVGDRLRLDVQNYRPEKIIFARAVKLQSFRKLGRETGVVCGVRDQGFGFVRSNVRDFNIFFRLSEVLGERGMPVKEGDICVGSCLSFDVVEETRGVPSPKMRAIRVQLLPSDSASSGSSHMPSLEGLHMDGDAHSHSPAGGRGAPASELEQQGGGGLTLLQAEVKGIIVSVAKRDAPGIIRASSIGDLGCNGESQGNQELYEAIKEFRDCKEIEEVILENVSSGLRKEYHSVLSEKFPGIGHEGRSRSLRLWKMSPTVYQAWKKHSDAETLSRQPEIDSNGSKKSLDKDKEKEDEGKEIRFKLQDTHDGFGPMTKDLKVIFSLYIDKKTNKRTAKNVRLTDEPVPGMNGDQTGILDVVVLRTGRFGFIRCLSSDEKLFWHSSGSASWTNQNDLIEGREVCFQMRRRGGLRCAVNIRVLPPNSLCQEIDLPGKCTGVVVDGGQVVILDVSGCPSLYKKYWDITKIPEILKQMEKSKSVKKKSATTWGKKSIEGDDKGGAGVGNGERAQGDLGGWLNEDPAGASSSSVQGANGTLNEDNDDEADAEVQDEVEDMYGAKYLPPLVRQPLPIGPSVTSIGVRTYRNMQVGDLVQCRVVANWVLQRHPLRVCDVELLSWSTLASVPGTGDPNTETRPDVVRMQGYINRAKVRVRGGEADGAGYELCEIKEAKLSHVDDSAPTPPPDSSVKGDLFFCDFREPKASDTSRDGPQQWDDVEFIGIRELGVAVAVNILPKKIKEPAAGAKRVPVNLSLMGKNSSAFQGFKAIKMAEGPPDDGLTVGFPAGWKRDDALRLSLLQTVSWGHLLRHLLPAGTILASATPFVPSTVTKA